MSSQLFKKSYLFGLFLYLYMSSDTCVQYKHFLGYKVKSELGWPKIAFEILLFLWEDNIEISGLFWHQVQFSCLVEAKKPGILISNFCFPPCFLIRIQFSLHFGLGGFNFLLSLVMHYQCCLLNLIQNFYMF